MDRMGDHGTEGWTEGGLGPLGRRSFAVRNPGESGGKVGRDSPTVGVWKKPGAGAAPTRPVEGFFDFSSAEPDDGPAAQSRPDVLGADSLVIEARRRAFELLDEWLAWVYVSDDDSVFSGTDRRRRSEPYRFDFPDTIADPRDVVRYALRGTGLFL